jgi:hypothetical protein
MIFIYLTLFVFLSFYSFSQVDLNLNLSQNSTWLLFENQLKQLGFYNRPLSFWIFISISILSIILYSIVLVRILKRNYVLRTTYYILLVPIVCYFLVYPAFLSYDIFNYLFDAKIVTKYYQNPYFHYALQYKFDTWTRFMRWTTRVYPYGPIWLLLTIIPVFLGLDKLVLTIFIFKIFNLLIFFGCLKIMQMILKKINKPTEWIWAFALNPIIIYDFLISMHNESLMLFFLLVSFYFFIVGTGLRPVRYCLLSLLFLLLSVGVKYLTVIFLPIYIFLWLGFHNRVLSVIPGISHVFSERQRGNKTGLFPRDPGLFLIKIAPLISLISLIPLIILREAYSWYFIIPIALLTLNFSKTKAIILVILSFLILRYSPYILKGEYSKVVVNWQNWISYAAIGAITTIFIFNMLLNNLILKRENSK